MGDDRHRSSRVDKQDWERYDDKHTTSRRGSRQGWEMYTSDIYNVMQNPAASVAAGTKYLKVWADELHIHTPLSFTSDGANCTVQQHIAQAV